MVNVKLRLGDLNFTFSPRLLIFSILYLFFVIADYQSSHQTGHGGTDRIYAHILLIAMDVYLFVVVLRNRRDLYKGGIPNSLINLSLWIGLCCILNSVLDWLAFVTINMSVLWVLCYYFFFSLSLNGELVRSSIRRFVWFFFLLFSLLTVLSSINIMERYNRFAVVNMVYYAEALLPWIIAEASDKERRFAYVIVVLMTLISMKRGAIVALPLMLAVDEYLRHRFDGRKWKRVGIIFLSMMILWIGFSVIDHYVGGYLSARFETEEILSGSGRIELYTEAINIIFSRDVLSFIFGVGAGMSVQQIGTGVHNEWLEFLFSFGLVGFLLYSKLIISMFTSSFKTFWDAPNILYARMVMTCLYLVVSFVSSGYGGYVGILMFGFWGYVDALYANCTDNERVTL